jgi:hypothetical protein
MEKSLDANFVSIIQSQLALQKEIIELSSKKNKNNSQVFKKTEAALHKLVDSLNKTIQNEYSIFIFKNNEVRLIYDKHLSTFI